MKKKISLKLTKIFFSLILFLVVLEVITRLFGIKPFAHFDDKAIEAQINKNFKNYMCNEDSIGIIPCESCERIIGQADQLPFKVTHLKDGSRYCGKVDSTKNILLITGDSNIHGEGVDDTSHVGYKLQSLLSDFHVINRAIPGSGNISQLLVLKESLKNYKPNIVIATYASYHNERNIFGRSIKKVFMIPKSKVNYFKFPYMQLENDTFKIKFTRYNYKPVPLSNYLALSEFINILIEKNEYRTMKADLVTKEIWRQYISLCRSNKIKLCVLVLTKDKKTEKIVHFLRKNKIEIIRANINDSLTLKPIDPHPNKIGHTFLKNVILNKLVKIGWVKNTN